MVDFRTIDYLATFFEEKDLPEVTWQIISKDGTWNYINNEVVIEHVLQTHGQERANIEETIRKIDYLNGDVNHFLRFLAGVLVGEIVVPEVA